MATPARVISAILTCSINAPAIKLSPGPYNPPLPPGLGARPPGLPPPLILGLAVGKMLGLEELVPLDEFESEEFPLLDGGGVGVTTEVIVTCWVCDSPFMTTESVLTKTVVKGVVTA